MNNQPAQKQKETVTDPRHEQLQTLIGDLQKAEVALAQFTNGQVDAIVASGATPYLLKQAQSALVENSRRYQQAMERVPALVFELSANGTIQFANELVEEITGYTQNEVVGKNLAALLLPGLTRRELKQLGHLLWQGNLQNFEVEIVGKNGRLSTLLWNTNIEYTDKGNVSKIYAYGIDITTRIQAEAQAEKSLQAQQQMARLQQRILDALPANVAVLDETGNIITTNEAWQRFGKENGGESFKTEYNYLDVCHIADEAGVSDGRIVGDGIRAILANSQSIFTHEYPCDSPTQSRWFQVMVAPLQASGAGAVVMHLDITDRKNAELAQQKANASLHERVKELTVLHQASFLLHQEQGDIEWLLTSLVEIIPEAWQHVEVAAARIQYKSLVFETANFKETPWRQHARFETADGSQGLIEVVYTEERPSADIGPFWAEEQSLLVTLADMLRTNLDQRAASRALQTTKIALQVREAEYRALFESNPLPILVYRQDTLAFLTVNKAAVTKYGYSREQFLQMRLPDLYPENMREMLATLEMEEAAPLRQVGYWPHLTANNQTIDVEITTYDLVVNESAARVMLANDVTEQKQAEKTLRQNEELLRQLTENTEEMFWIRDLETGKILYVNQMYEKLWGQPMEQLYQDSESFAKAIHPDDYDHVMRTRAKLANQNMEFKYRIVRPDGSWRWILARTFIIRNERGESYRVAGTARDITDRIQREQSLLAIEEIAYVLRDVENHADFLPAMLTKLQEIFGTPHVMVALVDEADLNKNSKLDYSLLIDDTGLLASFDESIISWVIETGNPYFTDFTPSPRYKLAQEGSENNRSVAVVPLLVQNQTIGILAIHKENAISNSQTNMLVTIGEMIASAIRRSVLYKQTVTHAGQLSQIIKTIPIGLLLLDPENYVLQANKAGHRKLAILSGAQVGDQLHELGGVSVVDLLQNLTNGHKNIEIAVESPVPFLFELSANPLLLEKDAVGHVLLIRDVTQERTMQERVRQQERLAAVGQLAAGIAHDFNNIMSVISIQAQLLAREEHPNDDVKRRIDIVYKQALHASDLIRQILDFSRRSVMDKIDINLVPMLKEMERLWSRTLPETIKLQVEYGDSQIIANVDLTRLQQVLMNLVVNARDAMPEGGELTVSLQPARFIAKPPLPEMPPGKWILLSVKDTGCGISPAIMPRIFEPFVTTKSPQNGTGLGLAQVYGIVKQHDGYIHIESSQEEGTTFAVYLPAVSNSNEVLLPDQNMAIQKDGNHTILVCEDDANTREAVVALMDVMGYTILIAENGKTAVEIYEANHEKIDLILTDMVMPEMNGVQLYNTLKGRYPDTKMVIMTGYPLEDEGKALLEQGILKWLLKPFSSNDLFEVINEVLQN